MLSLFEGPLRELGRGGHQLPPLAIVGDMIDEEKGIKGTHDKEPEYSCRQYS